MPETSLARVREGCRWRKGGITTFQYQRIMTKFIQRAGAALAFLLVSMGANAQLIDDIELRQEGADAVIQIKFIAAIQYRRPVASRAGDLVQVFYDVLPTRDRLNLAPGERRVVGGAASMPEIAISDEAVNTQSRNRKLVLRFSKPHPYKLRAGRGNRSVEVVLAGLGEAVRAVAMIKPGVIADSERRFIITLQSSENPGSQLAAAVPTQLQEYQTYTARRIVNGKTVYETNIGYFATSREAQKALAILSPRFPGAVVVATQPGTGLEQQPRQAQVVTAPQTEAAAAALLSNAQAAYDRGEFAAALEPLNQLLNLPPTQSTRKAQELVGLARLKLGDLRRARAEFEQFLVLYPSGDDSTRVRQLLDTLPQAAAAAPVEAPKSPPGAWSGSVSAFYFGGQSKVRNQEFQDSPISGLPELLSDNTLSGTDQSQVLTNVDLNWRKRDANSDTRFVFRDGYTKNLRTDGRSRNRLTSLYVDHRSFVSGTSIRLGRQSPTGAGVLYRFDGAQAGYVFAPKWKVNVVGGKPTDDLLDTNRHFYGFSIDAEALTREISGNLYFNQQIIDGLVDRRAVGTELRYFSGGVSAFWQLDYDTKAQAVNIASLQGTWQLADTTVFNLLYDRRATPILSLGNILFFQDPSLTTTARRVSDLLGTTPLSTLRSQVKAVTAYQQQGLIGATTPISRNWQLGGDVRLTSVGKVNPVPVILPNGQPSTGNQWSLGTQLIGTNIYSARDTHVFNATYLKGPTFRGTLLSYNNLTSLGPKWQLEPSLRYYTQNDNADTTTSRTAPGLRLTYRVLQQVTLESELSYERSKTTSSARNETADRVFYFVGGRYDF